MRQTREYPTNERSRAAGEVWFSWAVTFLVRPTLAAPFSRAARWARLVANSSQESWQAEKRNEEPNCRLFRFV